MYKKNYFSNREYITTGEILFPINNISTFDITGDSTGIDSSGCYCIELSDIENDVYVTNIDENTRYLLNPSLKTKLFEYDNKENYTINNDNIPSLYYPVDSTLFNDWKPFKDYEKNNLIAINSGLNYDKGSDWTFYKTKEKKIKMDEYLLTTNKRNDIVIEIPYEGSFNIGDYTYELRVNGMVTKYYDISNSNDNKIIITVDINKFEKFTGSNNSDYITLKIRNKYNFDYYIKTFSKYTNNIRPFISYDKMTETQDDISINCRFDISVKTNALSKDVISDISKNIGNSDSDKTVDYIKFDNKKILMGNNSIAYLTIENISDDIYYLLGKNDFIFNNDYFKTTSITIKDDNGTHTYDETNFNDCLYNETNSLILKPKEIVKLTIKSFDKKYNDKLTFNFIKLSSEFNYNDIKKEDLYKNIDCNIKIMVGLSISIPKESYFTDDEKEILKNIATFDKSLISSTYGNLEQFILSTNNNVLINENDPNNLNSDELKSIINNTHDITLIDKQFDSYNLICYGIIVNYMVLTNPDIADIKLQVPDIFKDIVGDSTDINSLVDVCNIDNNPITESEIGKNYLNAFNEESMYYKIDNNWCKKIIVPDTVFNLFNFTNVHKTDMILHPSMKFNINFKNNLEKDTMNSKLCIDYKPVKIVISKETGKDIVWTLYNVDELNINTEKILDVISREPSILDDNKDKSNADGTNGTINDTSSTIVYPEFINLDVTLETENGIVNDIGYAEYNGLITYTGTNPILIQPDVKNNIYPDFVKHEFSGIELKTYQVKTDLDKNTIENITGYLLEPQQQLKLKVYNDETLANIPEKFGKTESSITDTLYEKVWYIEKQENGDISVRKNYGTNSTNMNISVTVNPLVNANNTDSNIYKDIDTVLNINTSEIYSRDVLFYLLKDENTNIIDINNITLIDTIFSNKNNFYIDKDNKRICYIVKNLTPFDMKDITFPESGIDFSYEEIKNLLNEKYKETFKVDDDLTYGIEVIARTVYDSNFTNKTYNNVIITNYKDKNALKSDEKPKLNRLTGGCYHSLNILNKNEEFFDYKIVVDDIERNEGDVISNNTIEMSLHKFRLYYKLKTSDEWLLADSFEGVIDGTKPIQPKLIFNEKPLEKYPLLNKKEVINLISNFDNLLSEYNYYNKNVNIYSAINQEFNMTYTKDFITIKGTKGSSNMLIEATDKIYGSFIIENNSDEIVRCILTPDRDISNYIVISSNLLSSSIYQPNKSLNPIYLLQPKSSNSFYILFNDKNPNVKKGKLEIKIQNNVNLKNSFKEFTDEIKWFDYYIDIENNSLSSYNTEILKNLTSYKFFGLNDKYYTKEYYELNEIDNIIDFNNFNKPYLYKVEVYLDDILILNSNKSDKLLISNNRLNYYLYNGQHNIHIQTSKYNGMINYNDYYITIVDTQDASNNNYFTGISKDSEIYNDRNKLILRNESNSDFTHENELYMNSLGHPSIITKDIKGNLFPYRITESINKYMDFSKYLIDSNYTLHEYLQQNIIYYKNYIKENYDYFVEHGENKYSIGGTFDTLINNINSNFEIFDKALQDIQDTIENKTEKKKTDDNTVEIDFSATFVEDNILQTYKTLYFYKIKNISFKLSNDYKINNITKDNYKELKETCIIGDTKTSFKNFNLEEDSSYITSSIQLYLLKENDNNSSLEPLVSSGCIEYDKDTQFLSINFSKITDLSKYYNTNGKTKVVIEIVINNKSYYNLIIFENLSNLVEMKNIYQNINIFANTNEDKYKIIENKSDYPIFLSITNKYINQNTIFPENMIFLEYNEDQSNMMVLLEPNTIGKLHFKRDYNKDTLPDAYISCCNNYSEITKLCLDKTPTKDDNVIQIDVQFHGDLLEQYTDNELSSINKLYYFDKEYSTSRLVRRFTFMFNIYSFKGFALSELFKDGVPSNQSIKAHEFKLNFDENTDLVNINKETEAYFIIINDLYLPLINKKYLAYGQIYMNGSLNPAGVCKTYACYPINEDYNLVNKKKSYFYINFYSQPEYNSLTYIPIILSDNNNNNRKLTKNDFVSFSLNIIELNKSQEYPDYEECFNNDINYYGNLYYDESNKVKVDNSGKNFNSPSYFINESYIIKSNLINNEVFYLYPNTEKKIINNRLSFYRSRNPYNKYVKSLTNPGELIDKIILYPLNYINKNDKINISLPTSSAYFEKSILFDNESDRTTCPDIYSGCSINGVSSKEFEIGDLLYKNNYVTLDFKVNTFSISNTFTYYEGNYINVNSNEYKIFIPFDRSVIDDLGYFYSLDENENKAWSDLNIIIDLLNTNIDPLENKLKEVHKKIENMISLTSIIQINLNKQKKILNNKVTITNYKKWLDNNFQKVAGLYYRTNELLTDIYTSSSKGLNVFITEGNDNPVDLSPKGYSIFYDYSESANRNFVNPYILKHFIDKSDMTNELVKMINVEAYNFIYNFSAYQTLNDYNKHYSTFNNINYEMNDLRCKYEDYTTNLSFIKKLYDTINDTNTKIFDYPIKFN